MGKVEYKEVRSADHLLKIYRDLGMKRVIIKRLSANDNSKNQLYLGGGFESAQVFPHEAIIPDKSRSERSEPKFKAKLNFRWVDSSGRLEPAPFAQLILYPKYPEVRFSGFLQGCRFNLTELMGVTARIEGRLLIWGIGDGKNIVGHVVSPDNPAVNEFKKIMRYSENETLVILNIFSLGESSRDKLLRKLKEIHYKGWIRGARLTSGGTRIDYFSSNAGGYTLEAEFGITPNGYAEPDFEIWELKQYGVSRFDRIQSKPITLLTPEPTGGVYVEKGVKEFINEYGYMDRTGRMNRKNFGGVHKVGLKHISTGLTMQLAGYDSENQKITDADGSLILIDAKENIAALWSFSSLMDHWNRKHQHAAYIPSKKKREGRVVYYAYGYDIQLGEYTDFLRFLASLNSGSIYYDPAIKWEGMGTDRESVKRRSQFRVNTTRLQNLYRTFELVNLSEIQN